ncbi:MAG: DUF3987 domain-containing protein [Cyanobacteria bacterium]|nr:DUF3987 domain-containing protein [Cyanobacteriota bacterium]
MTLSPETVSNAAPYHPSGVDEQSLVERRWMELKPLYREIPPANDFPVDALGVLKDAVKVCHRVVQAPLAICAFSFIGAANVLVQAHADILIDGRRSPTSLFLLSVGESGERKSAVDEVALGPHREWEQQQRQEFEQDQDAYQTGLEVFESAKRQIINSKKLNTVSEKNAAIEELVMPSAPLEPILLVSEPTYEGMVKHLLRNLPFAGIFSDEGGRFLTGHAMSSENRTKTATGLSSLWDRGKADRVRAGDGISVAYGKRLALHLMAQPGIANSFLGDRSLIDQGLLSRCLIVSPESLSGQRRYDSTNIFEMREVESYYRLVKQLLEASPKMRSGTRNELDPRILELSPRAKNRYVAFHDEIQEELRPGGEFEPIRGLAAKAHDHAARLALTLAIFQNPEEKRVSEEDFARAEIIVRHCLSESLRLVDVGKTSQCLRRAEELLQWIVKRADGESIPLVDIYKKGPRFFRSARQSRIHVQILAEHGYLRADLNAQQESYELRPSGENGESGESA